MSGRVISGGLNQLDSSRLDSGILRSSFPNNLPIENWNPFGNRMNPKTSYVPSNYCRAKEMLATLKNDLKEAEVYDPILIKSCN